jgi:hypothetical protein
MNQRRLITLPTQTPPEFMRNAAWDCPSKELFRNPVGKSWSAALSQASRTV